jgi:hypothetical protein
LSTVPQTIFSLEQRAAKDPRETGCNSSAEADKMHQSSKEQPYGALSDHGVDFSR